MGRSHMYLERCGVLATPYVFLPVLSILTTDLLPPAEH